MNEKLSRQIKNLPASFGVYLLKNPKNKVIYVGKAKNLKKRVSYYFRNFSSLEPRIASLIKKVKGLDFLKTSSELEALILEANLIKEYRPRYNVCLIDDKQYPFLVIDESQKFPGLVISRSRKPGQCFGPYRGAGRLKLALKVLRDLFPLRICQKFKSRPAPCLEFQIKKCSGPCAGKISETGYRRLVHSSVLFLEGRMNELLLKLEAEMSAASQNQEYEKAALLRNKINSLNLIIEKQSIVLPFPKNIDVIAVKSIAVKIQILIIFIRCGKWVNQQKFLFKNPAGLKEEEFFPQFMAQYYQEIKFLPDQIITNIPLKNKKIIAELFSRLKKQKVPIEVPQKGIFKNVLNLALENLEELKPTSQKNISKELKNNLKLKKMPQRIAAFDISNLGPSQIVGAMVTFVGGQPAKNEYRKFIIRSFEAKPDDPAAIFEVVFRSLKRKLEEKTPLPDLILIDGGRSQLNAALKALKQLGQEKIETASLAKKEEKIFRPEVSAIFLSFQSPALKFLQKVRDEAHRFAISFHRQRRQSQFTSSFEAVK